MRGLRDYLDLTKPRITLLILICTAVGYWFGCSCSIHWMTLAHALLGTALLASGTSALNQWYEVDSDAKMLRTRLRPLPARRIKRRNGLVFGLLNTSHHMRSNSSILVIPSPLCRLANDRAGSRRKSLAWPGRSSSAGCRAYDRRLCWESIA